MRREIEVAQFFFKDKDRSKKCPEVLKDGNDKVFNKAMHFVSVTAKHLVMYLHLNYYRFMLDLFKPQTKLDLSNIKRCYQVFVAIRWSLIVSITSTIK